jgi:hypothetical protein
MNEEQADTIISLLESIDSKLSNIESNTSPVYDASDICSRLDDIFQAVESNTSSTYNASDIFSKLDDILVAIENRI